MTGREAARAAAIRADLAAALGQTPAYHPQPSAKSGDAISALRVLADAAGRYLYDATEASPEVRVELRLRLASAEEHAREILARSDDR